jgi:signal transduction histidine kinase
MAARGMDNVGQNNARLVDRRRRTAQLLARSKWFARLGQKLNSAKNTKAAARTIMGVANKMFGWDACTLSLYSKDTDRTVPVLKIDTIGGRRVDVTKENVTERPTARGRRVLEQGGQLILRKSPVFDRGWVPFGDKARPSLSIMAVPLRHGAEATGLLSIQSYTKNAYTPASLKTLQTLADYCGGALDRIRTEAALRQAREQLRALTARVQRVREAESLRIAREIHDVLGQSLTSINLDVVWLGEKIATIPDSMLRSQLQKRTRSMESLLRTTVKSVQRFSREVRPPMLDDLGLAAALAWQAEEFEKRARPRCRWTQKPGETALKGDGAVAMFRIFQEILSNVARHSGARCVTLNLQDGPGVAVLKVADDGRGFDLHAIPERKALGLTGMRERALAVSGRVDVQSAPGKGTVITVTLPLKATNAKWQKPARPR